MATTYEYKYDVKTIYDTFKNNRINVISYLGTSNNGKSEPNSSAYLSYVNNSIDTYIYARKSSPSVNSDAHKNYTYLKVGGTTYNFYRGYAYTYTETVSGQNTKPILIAYDFVNQISSDLKFNKVSINHNAASIGGVPQTVNVFSSVSYIIENGNIVKGPKNEYSISKSDITGLLNESTFADFTTYVTYSYLNSAEGDGIVHDDGKNTLSADPINDIHVWSLSDGVDMTPHAYVNNDTAAVNAYTYLNCGNVLNTFFRSNTSNIFDYTSNNYKYINFYYDINSSVINGLQQQWKAGIVGTDKIYAEELSTDSNKLNYSKFYQVCKVELDNVSSFNEIYNKPSLRNNSNEINCYININGESNTSNNQESLYIDASNKNKARFIKKISNLPINIFDENLKIKFYMDEGGGRPSEVTSSNYGRVSEGDIISHNQYLLYIRAKNKINDTWETLGKINISVSIVVDSVTESAFWGQSFTVKLANLTVNYDEAKWADENDTTHDIVYNMDDLYYTMWLDFDGDNGISFSANTDANNWNVSKETDDIYINKDNNIRDNYNLVERAISKIDITVSLDDSWDPI